MIDRIRSHEVLHGDEFAAIQYATPSRSGELDLLDSRIHDHQDQLEMVENQIQKSDINQLINRRNELEREISGLEREVTSIQVEINAKQDELEDIRREEAVEERKQRRKTET